jgi:hypothetical protein
VYLSTLLARTHKLPLQPLKNMSLSFAKLMNGRLLSNKLSMR